MKAGNGVAMPVAVTATVAAVVPVVVAMTGPTVNMAKTMATSTFPDGFKLNCPDPGKSRAQAKVFD